MAKKALMTKLKKKAEEMAKRKEERESGSGDFVSINYWKPRPGDNYLRILPHWESPEDEMPMVERVIHYIPVQKDDGGIINIPVACLKEHFEKHCPICEAVKVLGAKSKDDAKSQKLKGQLRPQRKVLYNILDYGDKKGEEPKVGVWPCPETVNEDIVVWFNDLEDFFNIETGFDWMLRKTLDKKRGPIGTRYKIIPSRKESAIPNKLRHLLDDMVNLDKVWSEENLDLMQKALDILGLEIDEIPFGDDEKPKKPSGKKPSGKKPSGKKPSGKSKPKKEEDDGPDFGDFDADDSGDDEAEVSGSDDALEEELEAMGVK